MYRSRSVEFGCHRTVSVSVANIRLFFDFVPHRLTFEFDSAGVGREPVHDGVGESRLVDVFVPFAHGQLRGHDDGLSLVAVFQYLQQRESRVVVQRLESEVVEDDEVVALDVVDYLQQRAVEFGERYFLDESVHGVVLHAVAHEAGLAADGTGEE